MKTTPSSLTYATAVVVYSTTRSVFGRLAAAMTQGATMLALSMAFALVVVAIRLEELRQRLGFG